MISPRRKPFCMWEWCARTSFVRGEERPRETDRVLASTSVSQLGVAFESDCHGFPWNAATTQAAAALESSGMLGWPRLNDCPWGYFSADGRLENRQFARENGCDWGTAVCSAAARNGHLLPFGGNYAPLRSHGWAQWSLGLVSRTKRLPVYERPPRLPIGCHGLAI